jgi:hypothetical protein
MRSWSSYVLVAAGLLGACGDAGSDGPHGRGGRHGGAGEERGLKLHVEGSTQPGHTLISPIESETVYLLGLDGEVVHTWETGYPFGGAVYLLDDGVLLRGGRKEDNPRFHGGGIGGYVLKHDWDGEVLWRFELANEQRTLHHDFEVLPNGNVLAICWDWHSTEEAVAHGRDPEAGDPDGFWPDAVIEIRPTPPEGGEIVWEWRAWDHLIQDRDPDKPGHGVLAENPGRIDINFDVALRNSMTKADLVELRELNEQMRKLGYIGGEDEDTAGTSTGNVSNHARTKTDWLHDNSVAYHPEHDLIVLSSPRLNEIFVIDHSTTTEEARGSTGGRWGQGGDLLYRWGNPRTFGRGTRDDQRLFFQHNPTWLSDAEDGSLRLLVFNNGLGRGGQYSTVEELTLPFDPEQGFVTPAVGPFDPEGPDWSFKLGGDYYAPFISGAQRLPNGNTLICAGVPGRLVEVTPDQRMVWDYMNPFGGEVPLPEQAQPGADMPPKAVFRATRIPEGDPRLAGRL